MRQWTFGLFCGTAMLYAARTIMPMCIVVISTEMNWDRTEAVKFTLPLRHMFLCHVIVILQDIALIFYHFFAFCLLCVCRCSVYVALEIFDYFLFWMCLCSTAQNVFYPYDIYCCCTNVTGSKHVFSCVHALFANIIYIYMYYII